MASNRRSLRIECERQASAARLRAMRSAHARSVAQLHALIAAGQKQMKAQEEAFLKTYRKSRKVLKAELKSVAAEYEEEVGRIAKAERQRVLACRRRLRLLRARSAALAAVRQAIAKSELGGDGRLYVEPVEPSDPLWAFVGARVEAEPSSRAKVKEPQPTLRMLCCLRLHRIGATAAAAVARVPGGGSTAAVAAGGMSAVPGAAAAYYKGVWWWLCAPVPELLSCAAKWHAPPPDESSAAAKPPPANGSAVTVNGDAGCSSTKGGGGGGAGAGGGAGGGVGGGAGAAEARPWVSQMRLTLTGEASVAIDTSALLGAGGRLMRDEDDEDQDDAAEDEGEEDEEDEGEDEGEEAEEEAEGEEEEEEDEEEEEEEEEGEEEEGEKEEGEEAAAAKSPAKSPKEKGKGPKEGGDGAQLCAALLCRANPTDADPGLMAAASMGLPASSAAAGGAAAASTSAASAAPEYLVVYEVCFDSMLVAPSMAC